MLGWLKRPRTAPATDAEALVTRADALLRAGDLEGARTCLSEAVAHVPGDARAVGRLGTVYHALGDLPTAAACYESALDLAPGYAEMHYSLGLAKGTLGELAGAEEAYRRAIALEPGFLEARFNLAVLLHEHDRLADAVEAYRVVLSIAPDHADATLGLALALQEARDLDASDAVLDGLLARFPEHPEANFYRSFSHLARGELATGWDRFARRWQARAFQPHARRYAAPEWQGEAVAGRTVLVWPEQGFGDTLQFARFATVLARRGARVLLESPPTLARLLCTLPGVEIVAPGAALPEFDFHVPTMSLPRFLARDAADIPADVPYLHPAREDVARWRARLAGLRGLKVGVAWAGDPRPHDPASHRIDRRRSLHFRELAPLARVPGIAWVSLQLGSPASQAAAPDAPLALCDPTADIRDFADTAALMQALDLVLTVDTSVVHLAGATARPTWLLSRFDGCWRWGLAGETGPWYPTVRILRQETPGDWGPLLQRVADDLRNVATGARPLPC
jgi:tetratricopeptide (TPR) repeat protein